MIKTRMVYSQMGTRDLEMHFPTFNFLLMLDDNFTTYTR